MSMWIRGICAVGMLVTAIVLCFTSTDKGEAGMFLAFSIYILADLGQESTARRPQVVNKNEA